MDGRGCGIEIGIRCSVLGFGWRAVEVGGSRAEVMERGAEGMERCGDARFVRSDSSKLKAQSA